MIRIPKGVGKILGSPKFTWHFAVRPIGPSQVIEQWVRGKTLGEVRVRSTEWSTTVAALPTTTQWRRWVIRTGAGATCSLSSAPSRTTEAKAQIRCGVQEAHSIFRSITTFPRSAPTSSQPAETWAGRRPWTSTAATPNGSVQHPEQSRMASGSALRGRSCIRSPTARTSKSPPTPPSTGCCLRVTKRSAWKRPPHEAPQSATSPSAKSSCPSAAFRPRNCFNCPA